jgi:hypothetical protein
MLFMSSSSHLLIDSNILRTTTLYAIGRQGYEREIYIYILVCGFNLSEKYWSNGFPIPNIWKNKNVPNHQPIYIYVYIYILYIKHI